MFTNYRREPSYYGDCALSVQASDTHYSHPRESGLPLAAYNAVEVGLIGPEGNLCYPSDVGLDPALDEPFEHGMDGEKTSSPVAGYVPQAYVRQLRMALMQRAVARYEQEVEQSIGDSAPQQ